MPDPMYGMLESLEPELPEHLHRRAFAALATTHVHPSEKDERYETAYREFGELLARPYVTHISANLERRVLCIATKTVYHLIKEHEGLAYEIGEMLILADIGNKKLRFENLTHVVDGYSHPHVTQDGTLCITNGGDHMRSLLADGRYLELADFLWGVLHLVRTGTPYKDSTCWPPKSIRKART